MPLDSRDSADTPVRVRIPATKPGPIQSYRKMQRNILELIPAEAYREPILSGGRLRRWHMVTDPTLIEQVLKTRETVYRKSDLTRRVLGPTKGDNVLVADGDAWKRQHRAMTPMFQHRNIQNVTPLMTEAADAWSAGLADRTSGSFDAYAEMIGITSDIICDAALSGREQLDRTHLAQAVSRYLSSISSVSFLDLIGAPAWIPRPARLFDRFGPKIDAMMDAIIAARIARGPSDAPDVLDMLVAAANRDDGNGLSLEEVRNNLLVFIIAGHETTALALTWALYLLAFDRTVQMRARAEAQDVLGGRPATAQDVPKLGYVRQVIEEAMRLYPPGALMTRTARASDELAGREIRRGDTVILPIYALHRHQSHWDNPDHFDPDRFAPEAAKSRNRYCYLPFSAGPRICIGMSFAMTEMTIILATYLSRVDLAIADGFEPRLEMLLTLRPADGVRLVAKKL